MKYIKLNSGAQIPQIGLGTWKMSPDDAAVAVHTAIELGYEHIDCAWVYQNESGVGLGIKNAIDSGAASRDKLWITSKLWNDCHRNEHVRGAIETTLRDLQLDYLDLYLIHWPIATKHGVPRAEVADDYVGLDEIPLAETWQALKQCQAAGLCKHIGVSNFNIKKIDGLIAETAIVPCVNQVEAHPLLQQRELFEYCQSKNIQLTGYSPLGSGDRPDEMKKEVEPNLFGIGPIVDIAEKHSVTSAQVLLAWHVCRGGIAIPKSSSEIHMVQNLEDDVPLDDDDMSILADLDKGYRFVDGKFWEMPGGPYTADSLWNG